MTNPALRTAERSAFVRIPELGLMLVILLLGVALTLGAERITVEGREVNNFLRLDNLIPNVATTMSWMAIMAVGVTIVIASGGIDISVGSIFGLAALSTAAALEYLRFQESTSATVVVAVAIGVPLLVGAMCGAINGGLVVGLRVHPFIVTLGTLSIFRGIALISVPTKSLPTPDYSLPAAFTDNFIAWQFQISRGEGFPPMMIQPVPMIIMLACVLAAWVFVSHTVGGRQVLAVGGNEEAARFAGLPIGWIKFRVYVLSGLAAGIAGMVSTGYFGSANTATGEGYELQVIAAAVVGGASLLGGRGTALGALLGALVIKMIENGIFIVRKIEFAGLEISLSKEYSKIIIGVAILLAVAVDRVSEHLRSRRA